MGALKQQQQPADWKQQIQEMATELTDLKRQQRRNISPVRETPNPHKNRLKMTTDKFNGNKKEFQYFLSSMEIIFESQPEVFNTDRIKTTYMLGFLVEGAKEGVTPYITNVEDRRGYLDNYKNFKSLLKSLFQDHTALERAQNQIGKLQQYPGPLEDYIKKFYSLVHELGWRATDPAVPMLFKNGLNWKFLEKFALLPETPTTLEEYINKARTFDVQFQQYKNFKNKENSLEKKYGKPKKEWAPKREWNPPAPAAEEVVSPNPFTRQSSSDMDLSQMETEREEQRKQWMRDGVCFYCKEKGHLRVNCPALAKKNLKEGGN